MSAVGTWLLRFKSIVLRKANHRLFLLGVYAPLMRFILVARTLFPCVTFEQHVQPKQWLKECPHQWLR
jgi:hypothetical protein